MIAQAQIEARATPLLNRLEILEILDVLVGSGILRRRALADDAKPIDEQAWRWRSWHYLPV
jgi:hypothetical protein